MTRSGAALAFRDPAASDAGDLARYLDTLSDLPAVRAYKELTFALLGPLAGARVLDVGCGTGDDIRALAERAGTGARLVGCDVSPAMVVEAAARAAREAVCAEFVIADAHELPFPSAAFRACRADRVAQHLLEPVRAVGEMVRVTERGGRIVISDPDWTSLRITPPAPGVERLIAACVTRARNPVVSDVVEVALRRAGLTDVRRHAAGARFTSLAVADAVIELRHVLEWDSFPASERERLWNELTVADRAGEFAAAIDGAIVWGTVP